MRGQRTKVTTAGLAIATLTGLTACGGGGNDGTVTLTVLDSHFDEPQNSLYQDLVETCAEDVGVEIDRTPVPGAELVQTVLQRSSSDTLPDLLMLDNPDIIRMAETGMLTPLSSYDIEIPTVSENIQDASLYEDELYGIQPAANTLGLFYNVDALSEAGMEPPQTWDELRETAEDLTETGQHGMGFSAIATYEGAWQLLPFMWTNGGDETNLDTPEVAEAIQLWVDLVEEGSASESVINWSQADLMDQFVAGNTVMMINGPWNIPSLEQQEFDWGQDWEVAQVPVNEEGATPVAPLGGEVWTVPATGDDQLQQLSAEMVECLGSADMQMELGVQRYLVPSDPSLHEEYLEERPEMEAFIEQVNNARSRTGQLGTDWPETAEVIYTATQLALTGQAEAEDAVSQAYDE